MRTACCALPVLIMLLCQTATGQIKGRPYLAADAGVSFLEDTTAEGNLASQSVSTTVEFNPGYRFDLRFGYFVPEGAALRLRGVEAICHFAFELETGFLNNEVSEVGGGSLSGTDLSMDFRQVPLLVNAILILPMTERLSVDLGFGLGAAITMMSATTPFIDDSSTDFGFAYQGQAKITYRLNPRISVSAFGKVLGSPDSNLPEEPFRAAGLESLKMEGPLSVSGGLGMSYQF